jgi:hypothetical protein
LYSCLSHCAELLCTYALITVFVDYLTFMSFYPSGLSLAIELMFTKTGRPQWDVKQIIKMLPQEETQNSVVYRYRYRQGFFFCLMYGD